MNFEDITKKLKKFGKDTVVEVQKLNEVRQLGSRINEEKKKLNSIYAEMGKKLYNQYKEAPIDGFEDEIRTIEEKFSMIDLLQDQIRAVKGVVLCPCCNTEVAATERFCSNCGSKMPEVIRIEENEAVEEVLEGEVVTEEAADETVEEAVEAAAEKAVENVEEADQEASETVEEVAEEAAEAEEEAVEEVTETVEDTAEEKAE